MKESSNTTNSLAYTKWNCKYHIVFCCFVAIVFNCYTIYNCKKDCHFQQLLYKL